MVHESWLVKLENTHARVFQVKSKEHLLSWGHGKTRKSTSKTGLWAAGQLSVLPGSWLEEKPRGVCVCIGSAHSGVCCVTKSREESEFLEMFKSK